MRGWVERMGCEDLLIDGLREWVARWIDMCVERVSVDGCVDMWVDGCVDMCVKAVLSP